MKRPPVPLIHALRPALIPLFCLLAAACVAYRPAPITPARVAAQLKPPTLVELRIRAGALRHPLLRAIPFNPGNGFSQDEAAVLAVIANPGLKALRDRRGVAAAQVLQAGILPNPDLSYSLDAPVGGVREGKVAAFGVGLDWEVSRLVSRSSRLQAAKHEAAAVDLDIAWQEWQVAQAARLHAVRLFWMGRQQRLAARRYRLLAIEEKALQDAVASGEATSVDLASVEKAAVAARLEVKTLQGEERTERLALNRAIGLPPSATIPLQAPAATAENSLPPLDRLEAGLEQRRLDLVALRLGYASQEARLRAEVRAQFPRLQIGLTGGRDSDRLQTAGVAITLGLPLFDRNQGTIEAARATRQELFSEYTARLFDARAKVAELRSRWSASGALLRTLRSTLPGILRRANACRDAAELGAETRTGCLPLVEADLDGQAQLLRLQRQQAESAVALDLVAGTWHGRIAGGKEN